MSDFSIKIPHQSANTDLVPADHVDITPEAIVTALRTYLRSNEFDKQLQEFAAFLAMKNDYYGDSWQVSGLITSLDDIVDKIFRVQTIRTHHGEVVGQRIIFPTKQENGYDLGCHVPRTHGPPQVRGHERQEPSASPLARSRSSENWER
jgi:hypothetical protein